MTQSLLGLYSCRNRADDELEKLTFFPTDVREGVKRVLTELFVAYYRVSTQKQGRSGLGLDAQRQTVKDYLGNQAKLVGEYVEVESGKVNARPQLERALAACRVHNAALVVSKVDRLTRSVSFLHKIVESGVDIRFCDMPELQGPAGKFMLNQMAAVAELEAGLISQRTRAALSAAKARGVILGNP